MLTQDGRRVRINYEHLRVHQDVVPLLQEALSRVATENLQQVKVAVDLGRIVGHSLCVETDETDKIQYLRRPGRVTQTRFVTSKGAQPCSFVTLILKQAGEQYRLVTAYIGALAEKEPDDPSIRSSEERQVCEQFWASHALVLHP